MFGYHKIFFDYKVPHRVEQCLLRLNSSAQRQTIPESFKPNNTVRVEASDRSVRIYSKRYSKESVTFFTGTFVGDLAPVTLSGYYRIGLGSRIFFSFGLIMTILIGGGMTLFLTYAALFATWSKGGDIRYLVPLFPLIFTVGMLVFLNYISKPDPSIIDSFLAEVIEATHDQESEQDARGNRR
jgi:hypothetical protein